VCVCVCVCVSAVLEAVSQLRVVHVGWSAMFTRQTHTTHIHLSMTSARTEH